jgi:hypothetical protein
LALSCTRAQPQIEFWTSRVVWYLEGAAQVPGMIFFVIANDPDGPEDLEELRLYHDGEGLMWRFTAETWERFDDSGRIWLGSKQLRMPSGESFPSGQYRAVIVDKAGEQGEKIFGFEPPKDSRYQFPRLIIKDGDYTISSNYPDNYILCYHSDGTYRNLIRVSALSGKVQSLRLATDVQAVALWADDPAASVSALGSSINVR